MPTATRQKLVETARKRFYRDGFRNVGIDQILSDVGISKTAFYKHFECKEDLMLAALEDQDRWVQNTFLEMVRTRGGETGVGQLNALFDVVDEIIHSDDFQGCIFVNVAMEFPLQHDPAHLAAARSKKAIEDLVAEIATQAGAENPRGLGAGTVPGDGGRLCHAPRDGESRNDRHRAANCRADHFAAFTAELTVCRLGLRVTRRPFS